MNLVTLAQGFIVIIGSVKMTKEDIHSILTEIKKAKNWIEESDKYNGNALHILQHLKDFIENISNKKCDKCEMWLELTKENKDENNTCI